MRIGLDGSAMLKQPTGIGRYTRCLIEALARQAPDIEFVVVTVSYKDRPEPGWFRTLDNVTVVHKRWPGRAVLELWERFRWPNVEAAIGPVALFHSPNNYIWPHKAGRAVTTIHDLFFLHYPRQTHKTGGQYYWRVLPRIIGEADHIITDSNSTAEAVRRAFSVGPEKVSVVYPAVDERFFATVEPERTEAVLERFGIKKPYLLHFGTIEPRKGLDTLLAAMEMLWAKDHLDAGLVLAGLRGWACQEIIATCARLRKRWPLWLTGYLPEEDVAAVIAGAQIAVIPSRYEGFGLPALEAMALGVPVIASDAGALPEVLGDAAVYFDRGDPSQLAERIKALWQDSSAQSKLVSLGRRRARLFTWEKTAKKTLAIYRRLLSSNG